MAASIMRQIFTAVEYCHMQQIVHRDLKPENIVFTGESLESTLKVIDFGRSKILAPKTKITDKAGTVPSTLT
jgi:calcium-dependent protein kinase